MQVFDNMACVVGNKAGPPGEDAAGRGASISLVTAAVDGTVHPSA